MKLRLGDRVLDVPQAVVAITLVESPRRGPLIELELSTAGASAARLVYLRPGERATLSDAADFRPGDAILGPKGQRYVVRDPVRTRRGYLRVTGPLGGSLAVPWRLDRLPPGYRVDDGSLGD